MKKYINVAILLFFVLNNKMFSQTYVNDYFRLKKQVLLEDNEKKTISVRGCKIVYTDDNLYLLDLSNEEKDKDIGKYLKLHKYSKDNKHTLLKVPIIQEKFLLFLSKDAYFKNYTISNNYLCLIEQMNVYIYKIDTSNNKVDFLHKVKYKSKFGKISFDFAKIEGNKLILMMCNMSSQSLKSREHTSILIYDILEKKIITEKILENPSGVEHVLFIPFQNMDYQNGYFAIADFDNYNIKIYDDKNIQLLHTISRVPQKWKPIENCEKCKEVAKTFDDDIKQGKLYSIIGKLNRTTLSFSVIKRVNFLNDTTLLVCYENRVTDDYWDSEWYYDIWVYRNGKWVEKYVDLFAKGNRNSPQPNFCFSMNYVLNNGNLVFRNATPFIIKPEDFNNLKSMEKKIEDYFIDNPLKYSAFIYDFKN